MALPESWKFRKPSRETKNTDTPILERYIHTIFRKQVIDFNSESDPRKADSIFHLENECVCFHTGLYTRQYKGIYGYFERNNFSDSLRDWYFRGFCDEMSPKLRYIEPLPQKPVYHMAQSGINFNPEWPIRVNVNELNGSDYLEFSIPFKDGKRSYLDNEKKLQITKDIYRIRTVTDDKGEDGNTVTSIYAEAAFYDLVYSEMKSEQTYEAETAEKPIAYALQGAGWSVETITVTTKRSWQSTDKNALSMLRTIQSIYGGDLEFDNVNKQVSLLTQSGSNSGAVFAYRKNMKSIQRVVDTRSLVTRLYAYGADGMTFASINNGKEYVENTEYLSEIRVSTLDCSSFTNPYQMLEYTEMRLADYLKPSISYVIQVMDLSVLTGWEHESFGIGDVVTVDDKDLGIRINTRIIRMDYNVQEPWKTVIELSTKLKELGDSSASWEKAADTLSSLDLLDRQEMKDLVVNNHLMNSRADDGFSYWQNSGFDVDGENGASGNASFKCVGALNTTKTLSQEVYPATRSSYTVSASIATENLKKGANGRVGIELVIEYEDGSEETRFVELY